MMTTVLVVTSHDLAFALAAMSSGKEDRSFILRASLLGVIGLSWSSPSFLWDGWEILAFFGRV